MKIVIIGGSGMIGSYLIKSCKNEGYDTEFTFYKNKLQNEQGYFLDITKHKDTIELIKKINPDIVFLTSAITDMDLCERNSNLAMTKIAELESQIIEETRSADDHHRRMYDKIDELKTLIMQKTG